jgi:5-enolpyruvylshikimate-3-phosphate synthase
LFGPTISGPYANKPVRLRLDQSKGRVVSKPYIDMTISLMHEFGIHVKQSSEFIYDIPLGHYRSPITTTPTASTSIQTVYQVEGDASSAAYALSMAAITGGRVTVTNVGSRSCQGDAKFATQLLAGMGAIVTQTPHSTTVVGPSREDASNGTTDTNTTNNRRLDAVVNQLRPASSPASLPISHGLKAIDGDIDMNEMTDSFMALAAVAAFANGTTRIVNIAVPSLAGLRVVSCSISLLVCNYQ